MNSVERRASIKDRLAASDVPLKGAELATLYSVSRQIVVQDIAVLRAEGAEIVATPQGYLLLSGRVPGTLTKTLVARHIDFSTMEDELCLMVDHGARVLNVIVEHPLYGEITGSLMIFTRDDVTRFMEKMAESEGEPLSMLTGGVHLHTLEVPDERTWSSVVDALREKGYLLEDE